VSDLADSAREASLLDIDPTLAHVLGARVAVTTGRLPRLEVVAPAPGAWTPRASRFAVLDGLLLCGDPGGEISGAFGPGDLIGACDLEAGTWTAGPHVRLAVIDESFTTLIRPWPQVEARMAARAARQEAARTALRAAARLTNPEERLLAVLWSLVARWGEQAQKGFSLRIGLDAAALTRLTGLGPELLERTLRALDGEQVIRTTQDAWLLTCGAGHADTLRRRRDELRHRVAEQLAFARTAQRDALAVFERIELTLAAALEEALARGREG
jgi:CRP-like cAMP-binding protein